MSNVIRVTGRNAVIAGKVIRTPLYARPGHFYSPVASGDDAARAEAQRKTMCEMWGISLRPDEQVELARELAGSWKDSPRIWRRYFPENNMFGLADSSLYMSILRRYRPSRIVEVGSGFSSALALDMRDAELHDLEFTFIEPYPSRLLGLLTQTDRARSELIQRPVQDVDPSVFESLQAGDILFIDSSHVGKAGSDVNWLLFNILPRLAHGVLVHLHDIFYPFEYSTAWLHERRSWNECYLIRAFLTHNDVFSITLFASWLWSEHPEIIDQHLPRARTEMPGSLWLTRVR